MVNITFSTCWYNLRAKFPSEVYSQWIDNMLSNVNNYYLVVYTDKDSYEFLKKYETEKIKIIVKKMTDFYNYQFKDNWIKNHEMNLLLRDKVDWKVNMLWCEKIYFVDETITKEYFKTEFYGWCDIGYFRNRKCDMSKQQLENWPAEHKIESLNKNKIYYAVVNNDSLYINQLFMLIQNKNNNGLPVEPIPPNQISIAGGFFILHKDKIEWWKKTFNDKLQLYFKHNYLVKDDQIIIIDCILSNITNFQLTRENTSIYDNWFLFQRFLS
jgi:hypothetical protein